MIELLWPWLFGIVFIATIALGVQKFIALLDRATKPEFPTLDLAGDNVIPFVKATREQREQVMQIQGCKCANPYCNTDLRNGTPHWDHIIPRAKGGNDSIHNMQWLCSTCNLNKGTQDWLPFIYQYATGLGIDPNVNEKPWQQWIMNRAKNGLRSQCQ